MRRLLGVVSVALLACGVPSEELDVDPSSGAVAIKREAIVGGRVTWGFPQTFNLYMEFRDGSAGTCSASLVGRRTLLTAAHCIKTDDKRGSASFVDAHNETVRRNVRTFIDAASWQANPDYTTASVADESGFDVALVKLTKEPFVRPMEWNAQALDQSYRAQTVEATGYGVEAANLNNAGFKRTITIPLASVADRTLVTGTNVPLRGTCFGDIGGGIVYRFPDGVRRVIGVNSKTRMAECGPGTSTRVDANDSWVRPKFDEFDAPTCDADNECVTVGCATPDPDCACVADGQCNAACTGASIDADCADACAENGVCATVACGTPDPDCAPVGSNCGRDAHCASRLCRDSPQHPEPYCTQTCDASTPCPGTLECVSGTCRYPILPTAALAEPCTPGATLCDFPDGVCVAIPNKGPDTACRQRCLESDDCGTSAACVEDTDGTKACAPVVRLENGTQVELPAGCSSVGGTVMALAALLLARRRR